MAKTALVAMAQETRRAEGATRKAARTKAGRKGTQYRAAAKRKLMRKTAPPTAQADTTKSSFVENPKREKASAPLAQNSTTATELIGSSAHTVAPSAPKAPPIPRAQGALLDQAKKGINPTPPNMANRATPLRKTSLGVLDTD
jgi:hypothetical protein